MSYNTPSFNLISLSKDDKHFFFGFHDLPAWNSDGTRILALRTDKIDRPPDGKTAADVGFFENEKFVKVADTIAYNYPQGARQQWIGKSNLFIINDLSKSKWISKIYDSDTLQLVEELNFTTHIVSDDGIAFTIDYPRLHRVGGYGYTGLKDASELVNAPSNIGIFVHNVFTYENKLLVSINEVANFLMSDDAGNNHYITHLVFNPAQNRIAFLHRYKLKDGGETTRLMTISTNGQDLRCLATGFLSHFDWKNDNTILIWGRINSNIEKFRNSFVYKLIPNNLLIVGKKLLKMGLRRTKSDKSTSSPNSHQWLLVKDIECEELPKYFASEIMTEDGHPMFCPANRDWLVCDTYPNSEGIRELYLYNDDIKRKVSLGLYKMLTDTVNLDLSILALQDVDSSVLKSFDIEKMAFYRSGLHCDLHPRWQKNGKHVCFDSIHEGFRGMYIINVEGIL